MTSIKVEITSHITFMTEGTLLTEESLYMKNKYLKVNFFKHGNECKIQYNDMTLTLTQQP